MSVVLHPRVASGPGRVRVWLGITNLTQAPALTWHVDGQPQNPQALRPLASARSGPLLAGNPARAFTGLYEFANLAQGRHRVRVSFAGGHRELVTWTTPALLPRTSEGTFNVLLASCFYRREASAGAMRATLARIRHVAPPHMTLLMGDQVYLDLPTLANFKDDSHWLANKFEGDYVANWFDVPDQSRGFYDLLQMAPAVHLPDDHEFYNNAPHRATVIQNSWKKASRDRWLHAAAALYQAFQASSPNAVQHPFRVDVAPVSFLLADSRTDRQRDLSRAFAANAANTFEAWVGELNAKRLVGVFATGQPLLASKKSAVGGAVADYALANYGDWKGVMNVLAARQSPLVLLTGDVHYNRVAEAGAAHRKIVDCIVSPLALVKTDVKDEAFEAWDWVAGLVGKSKPWPRHSKAPAPPKGIKFGLEKYDFSKLLGGEEGKGDQMAVLQFSRDADKVRLSVKYFHVQSKTETPRSISLLT